MYFWRETEKVHFCLLNEHDTPVCSNLEIVKEQRYSRIGDTSAPIESVEPFKSETACGVAEQSAKERNVKSSRVVPEEPLCVVKETLIAVERLILNLP